MVLFRRWNLIMTFLVVLQMWVDVVRGCDRDLHCKRHQVCCGKRCRSWPKCFLNSDKECYYNTHCIKGAICVQNECKPPVPMPNSCRTDSDCDYKKHSNSHENIVNSKCCEGKCFKMRNCSALKLSTTPTRPYFTSEPCSVTNSCLSDRDYKNDRHTVQVTSYKGHSKGPDNTLSRAGFLSAAILTAAVFLVVMCCCIFRETKMVKLRGLYTRCGRFHTSYYATQNLNTIRRNAATLTESRAQCHNTNAPACQISTSWVLFPDLYGPNEAVIRNSLERHDCRAVGHQSDSNSIFIEPPPYHSLCFQQELPPSYDEVVNCHSHNYINRESREHNPPTTERCS